MEDPRFKDLFENPDFMINEADEEYARVKPTVEKAHKKTVTVVPESEQINTLEVYTFYCSYQYILCMNIVFNHFLF